MEKDLYAKIKNKLDDLINNDLQNLTENPKILYSDKVIKVKEYVQKKELGQCIVFVERVYTAAFLCQVLRKIMGLNNEIKHLAGSKAYSDGISISNKDQVRKDFNKNFVILFAHSSVK